jgi:hypothetical protein
MNNHRQDYQPKYAALASSNPPIDEAALALIELSGDMSSDDFLKWVEETRQIFKNLEQSEVKSVYAVDRAIDAQLAKLKR